VVGASGVISKAYSNASFIFLLAVFFKEGSETLTRFKPLIFSRLVYIINIVGRVFTYLYLNLFYSLFALFI
jgi:hypothetical protein